MIKLTLMRKNGESESPSRDVKRVKNPNFRSGSAVAKKIVFHGGGRASFVKNEPAATSAKNRRPLLA
jgi:hypothetical protein